MPRPELLQIIPVTPEVQAEAEASFAVRRLFEADDPDRYLREVAPGIRAVFTNGIEGASRDLMEMLPALEIVAVYGVGVDAVDLELARARGIRVSNTPDVLTTGVAELGMALLLDVARKVTANDRFVRARRWPKEGDPPLANSLAGRKMGILGLGRIGLAVAERARVFGMDLSYHGPRRKEGVDLRYHDSLIGMARAVDVLMVTCLGGPVTKGLVSREVIEALGPEGWLINVARGSVVDEAALVEALVSGRLGRAGLDVFAEEPNVPEALLDLDSVVLQPHQASGTVETRNAMGRLTLKNLEAHFAGQPLPTPVV